MSEQHYVESRDLALAWALALSTIVEAKGDRVSPIAVSVTGFEDSQPIETQRIRAVADAALADAEQFSCDTVASTIFPGSMWDWRGNAEEERREQLYERYLRLYPRLMHRHRANCHGTYFGRLIAYRGPDGNQLEHIIETFGRGNHRHSALIAAVFDAEQDHSHQRRRGFPCMHEVTFELHGTDGLGITGFYATQYYYSKAYGNLLGLSRLGRFMAQVLQRQLVRVNCVASVAQLGSEFTKKQARELLGAIGPLPGDAKQRTGGVRV